MYNKRYMIDNEICKLSSKDNPYKYTEMEMNIKKKFIIDLLMERIKLKMVCTYLVISNCVLLSVIGFMIYIRK